MDRSFATTCSLGGPPASTSPDNFETKPGHRADVPSANADVKLHDSPVCPEGGWNVCTCAGFRLTSGSPISAVAKGEGGLHAWRNGLVVAADQFTQDCAP